MLRDRFDRFDRHSFLHAYGFTPAVFIRAPLRSAARCRPAIRHRPSQRGRRNGIIPVKCLCAVWRTWQAGRGRRAVGDVGGNPTCRDATRPPAWGVEDRGTRFFGGLRHGRIGDRHSPASGRGGVCPFAVEDGDHASGARGACARPAARAPREPLRPLDLRRCRPRCLGLPRRRGAARGALRDALPRRVAPRHPDLRGSRRLHRPSHGRCR